MFKEKLFVETEKIVDKTIGGKSVDKTNECPPKLAKKKISCPKFKGKKNRRTNQIREKNSSQNADNLT